METLGLKIARRYSTKNQKWKNTQVYRGRTVVDYLTSWRDFERRGSCAINYKKGR